MTSRQWASSPIWAERTRASANLRDRIVAAQIAGFGNPHKAVTQMSPGTIL